MRRTAPAPVRVIRRASLLVAAVLLSGCAGTVAGTAAGAGVGLTLATTSAPSMSSSADPSAPTNPPRPTTTSSPSAERTVTTEPTDDPTDAAAPTDDRTETTEPTGEDSYTDMALGDAVVVWDDAGEADVYVRGATFVDGTFEVTVDYECYDGECPYYVSDWTVTDASGERYRPIVPSGFGDTEEQAGVLDEWSQKRGHLHFDIPAGAVTVEFDAISGDPATWLVLAA